MHHPGGWPEVAVRSDISRRWKDKMRRAYRSFDGMVEGPPFAALKLGSRICLKAAPSGLFNTTQSVHRANRGIIERLSVPLTLNRTPGCAKRPFSHGYI